ncbi:pyridoxamine 5'-phosphate oxidase family protein [Halorubrum sp. 48-1-W]|uniref:pyridoxamine 5'-phosphate oxidase family protein n=1 Tax=Halorubrum sp. 48-1-W TaxID=2249761 RepID=UPI000DCC155B|nr:pyridoxamine 5'-phosphate oxidase family protein [Halorubrum sp. 48-1-W]RAW46206.1 pyridoxamine 5'-phosphate oxidase family protein [Halorubrum sp. 48-1-W]
MRELSSDEIDEVLTRNGIGILGLTSDGQPYTIPMSFGYDGERMAFPMQWGTGYEGRKERYAEANANASFAVYEQDPDRPQHWRSIVMLGELYEVEDEHEDRAFASLAANAEFAPDLGVWGVPFDEVELRLFGLAVDECTGREFSPRP